jgi:hypothetical protein
VRRPLATLNYYYCTLLQDPRDTRGTGEHAGDPDPDTGGTGGHSREIGRHQEDRGGNSEQRGGIGAGRKAGGIQQE